MALSKRLRELRTLKGLNQSDIADLLKVERSTYGKYETGDSSPDYGKLVQLANFFNVNIDYLLGRTDIKTPVEAILEHQNKNLDPAIKEIESLSEESLKELESYIRLLKIRDQLNSTKNDQSSALEKNA